MEITVKEIPNAIFGVYKMKTTIPCKIIKKGPDSTYEDDAEISFSINENNAMVISIDNENVTIVNHREIRQAILAHKV